MISPTFVEANYEILESLLRERRNKIRNEDLRTELEYFSEEYDEERGMEPRPVRIRETTLVLRMREEGRVERNFKGGRPSELGANGNRSQATNLSPLLAAHLWMSENGQPLQSSFTSVYRAHQPSTIIGGNLLPNGRNKQYILDLLLSDKTEAGTTSTTLIAKLPILNPLDYNLWLMRIEQYFAMTDYTLWEVILNGNKVLKRIVGETEQEYEPTTVDEKQDSRNEMKARGTLLMAFPNKDQLKFHSYKDAKLLMEAIEKRYGGNKESKKVQRTLLKQQYKNFTGSSSETMDQTFDSINSNSNSNTNEPDNTAFGVSSAHTQSNPTSGDNLSDAVICAFLASQPNSPQLSQEDLEQIDPDDPEEMDLQWEMAMLTIRARRFIKRTGRKLDVNGQRVGFNRSKVECYDCHKNGHFARECKLLKNQEKSRKDISKRTVTVETPTENALEVLPVQTLRSIISPNRIWDIMQFPPPYIGNFIPFKPNLTFMDEIVKSENLDVTTVVTPSNVKKVESNHESANIKSNSAAVEPKTIRKNNFRPPIIEDRNSDDDSEVEFIPTVEDKTVRPSTKKIKFVKSAREKVEKVETPKQNKHYPRGK
ncbi:ribonuclease H-like domain-containing protein [Tanacetum coccineum]